MVITVMIPTYRRPDDLRRCLSALTTQIRVPDDVCVVLREDDEESWEVVRRSEFLKLPVRTVTVGQPGQVQALNAGLSTVTTDIVAITDDDAAPHTDWTKRIVEQFEARPDVGGVGGRDRMHVGGVLLRGHEKIVGKVPRFGKHRGNHHLGFGEAREVDIIKGVNGSYRTVAIRPIGFDTRLRGTGAQVHWEISLGLALKKAGWKLLYDPEIVVDHFLAKRFDEDQRNSFNTLALANMSYNETLVRLEHLSPAERALFLTWAVLVGTRSTPGAVQWVRFLRSEGSLATTKLTTTLRGRYEAWRDVSRK